MHRPPVEVADVIRAAGQPFVERARTSFDQQRWKALGHIDEYSRRGKRVLSYNSCRNRHCPKCQGNARHRWLEARGAELLPTCNVHVVFTLPHELSALALANKEGL